MVLFIRCGIIRETSRMFLMLKVSLHTKKVTFLLTILTDGIVHEHIENEEFADLTDFKLRSFRYPL